MYILYESYNDETRIMKDKRFNTNILGVYESKQIGLDMLKEVVNDTIIDTTYNWFVKEFDKDLFENDSIVACYSVFNEEIDNCDEYYSIILERLGVEINE